jgi:hypothetical protein
LERKHTVQGISREQERNGNYDQETTVEKEEVMAHMEISKMVQSIQISPKNQWGLSVGSRYERGEPIYETNPFQEGRYSNSRSTPNEEQLCDLL